MFGAVVRGLIASILTCFPPFLKHNSIAKGRRKKKLFFADMSTEEGGGSFDHMSQTSAKNKPYTRIGGKT